MDELLAECAALGKLSATAEAIVRYASALGVRAYTKKGQRYVAEPNFVTFEVHWQRATNLTVSLRGNPEEFLDFPELPAKRSQNGYSEVKVTEPRHLLAVASYIQRARTVFDRGRTRVIKTPKVVEG